MIGGWASILKEELDKHPENPQPKIHAPWVELNAFRGQVRVNYCMNCRFSELYIERTCLGWMGKCEWCGCVTLICGGSGYVEW